MQFVIKNKRNLVMIIIFSSIKSVNQFVKCHEIFFVLLSQDYFSEKSNNHSVLSSNFVILVNILHNMF